MYRYDFKRFSKSFTTNIQLSDKNQLESRLIFHAHALEKGFSHEKFREGFGIRALESLSECLNVYRAKEYPKDSEKYQLTLSSIHNYIEIHKRKGYSVDFLKEIFSQELHSEIEKSALRLSGVKEIVIDSKRNNAEKNFVQLANGRSSIREYAATSVDYNKIKRVVEVALKTPSVCNRQPVRIYSLENREKIRTILDLQAGYKGYELPPILLTITVSNASFFNPAERNEGFIDGGLFSMSILYGLEYEGLGACALNAMMSGEKEDQIKEILEIPDNEMLIMFLTVGNLKEISLAPISYRVSVENILRSR